MRKYQAVCEDCGGRGPVRGLYADALRDTRNREHRCPRFETITPEQLDGMARRVAGVYVRLHPAAYRSMQDLAQDAAVAGLVALPGWRPDAGQALWTYLWGRMHFGMLDGIRKREHYSRGSILRLRQAEDKPADEVLSMTALAPLPLDALRESGYDAPDSAATDAFDRLDGQEHLAWLLDHLEGRERDVVERNVLAGEKLGDIGREYKVTESRMCQVKRRALERLADVLAAERALTA